MKEKLYEMALIACVLRIANDEDNESAEAHIKWLVDQELSRTGSEA